jgi:Zn-dependent peptidase ImmA (M78 family)
MAYRRGFKSEAEALAREIRAELGLGPLDPLDPFLLADHLEIPVVPLSDIERTNAGVCPLLTTEQGAFSAVTVFRGNRRLIVHNDAHHPARQNSNIAHELAHGLLLHPPTAALDNKGCREWNEDIEDEAAWLAGALLITEDAALAIVRQRHTLPMAADFYKVSVPMVQYRINCTGARRRVERARQYRRMQ